MVLVTFYNMCFSRARLTVVFHCRGVLNNEDVVVDVDQQDVSVRHTLG